MNDKELDIALDQLRQKDYPADAFQSKDQFKASFFAKAAAQDKKERSRFKYVMVSFLSAAACLATAIIFVYQESSDQVKTAPAAKEEFLLSAEQKQAEPENNTPAAVQEQTNSVAVSPAPAVKEEAPAKQADASKATVMKCCDLILEPEDSEQEDLELEGPESESPESTVRYKISAPVFTGRSHVQRKMRKERAAKCVVQVRVSEEREANPSSAQKFNTEEYKSYEDNPFLEVRTNPLSTFGADVDTASYTNLRRLLKRGGKPDRNAVRTEELLNYFSYDYAAPKDGEKFAVNFEMMDAPWNTKHKLLLIGVQAKKVDVEKLPPSNFVFLIDDSGSMSDSMELVRESMTALADTMRGQDTISLVTYGGGVKTLLQGIRGCNKDWIKKAIGNLDAGGYTPGGAGIQEAYKLAHKYFIPGGNNRIILITDGDFNVGTSSESELVSMVEKERQSAIYLTAIGVGEDNYKDNKLKMLANKGNGNYLYWDSAREARNSLLNEMTGSMFTLAKDVKFQLEMNPAKIHSYRLIGYEFRKLADRDFNDDTKDSGEVGIGQQVTVLYELVMADGENKSGVDPLKYQEVKNTGNTELLTCKMRYQEPEGNAASVKKTFVLNEMPKDGDNIHWAAAVAEFALILRDSPHKGNADLKTLRQRAQKYLGEDKSGKRIDFLNMIRDTEIIE